MKRQAILAAGIVVGVIAAAEAASVTTHLAFTFTHDIQTNLIKEFPTGKFAPAGTWKASFSIPKANPNSTRNPYNFYDAGQTLTISTSIYGVTSVYTLMNAYSPPDGATIATVTFTGSAGATKSFALVAGTNIRDFYQGEYANSINGTTTRNAFMVQDVQDAGGTGNVNTGAVGTYVVDEQQFKLPAAFHSQTLTQITITPSGSGTPILLGATAKSETAEADLMGGLRR
jgi:hypothetical protein